MTNIDVWIETESNSSSLSPESGLNHDPGAPSSLLALHVASFLHSLVGAMFRARLPHLLRMKLAFQLNPRAPLASEATFGVLRRGAALAGFTPDGVVLFARARQFQSLMGSRLVCDTRPGNA